MMPDVIIVVGLIGSGLMLGGAVVHSQRVAALGFGLSCVFFGGVLYLARLAGVL